MFTKVILITALTGTALSAYAADNTAAKQEAKGDHHHDHHKEVALAPEISLDELKTAVEKKSAFIIDVNSKSSYAEGRIPGSIHYGSSEAKLASVLPKDKNALIVAYCGGPMCTAWEDAAKQAKALGYTNIKHYKGGIKTWRDQKLPVDKG